MNKEVHVDMTDILSMADLSLGNKSKTILYDINLSLKDNEFLAVIGPNGAGKSSLIKTIMGELDILSGSAQFLGKDLRSYDHKSRSRHIALMGQHNSVDPRMEVKEFIRLGRFPHFHYSTRQYDDACVERLIEDLSLERLIDRKIGALSGGEFQRVNVARVLAQEPRLLLLDEPTNHLDPIAKIHLLSRIKKENIATIAVLHDVNLIEYFADKVLIINNGTMSICSNVEETLNQYWMNCTFGLDILKFTHPTNQRKLSMFDIPESK